ncbi:hypothetical protein [Flavobacterium piscisymbiosum]|uniref:Uncharacterized protein n=1 Tax=Flavobacterium piscisymbiosum TaxID=2893753 RepID=A0ABS8MGK8_9FLAO|nr:hypothetical protein [Flavobacterium sp. F-30]MCC9064096.1 hypothetical protein [Flavobacterium sp. F-30]
MKKSVLSFGSPKELEAKRIAEIKSLSYLERLMILIEVSYTLKIVNRISIQKRMKFY